MVSRMGGFAAVFFLCIAILSAPVVDGRHMVGPSFRPATIQSEPFQGPQLCEACQTLMIEAQVVLTDPDNINFVVALAKSQLCHKLLDPQLVSKCRELVEEYVPALFQIIAMEITPDNMCGTVCPLPPLALVNGVEQLNGREECQLCQYAATSLIAYLASEQTQIKILEVAHTACLHVKRPELQTECTQLVDEYVPQLLAILQTITPAELCHILSFCPNALLNQRVGNALLNQGVGKDRCLMCQILILELKFKLEQPETQAKLIRFLEETCTRIPNLTEQCTASIAQYAPLVFENLDAFVDPRMICKKLHACPRAVSLQETLKLS